jgi:hypothetical protein
VAGDAEDAGDVVFEAHDMGVSGVSGGVPYDDIVDGALRVGAIIVGWGEVGYF